MRFEIPKPLQVEHAELHARLVKATKEAGAIGEAAREVARLLHPHFVREEEFALPPLALLERLARGEAGGEMAEVLPMTQRLRAELPQMLAEHGQIVGALEKLHALMSRPQGPARGVASPPRAVEPRERQGRSFEQSVVPRRAARGQVTQRLGEPVLDALDVAT